jgi:hypothetical protein
LIVLESFYRWPDIHDQPLYPVRAVFKCL